jgi:hypothetical protein
VATKTPRRRWLRLLPWIVTAAVVAAILYKYPIGEIIDEARAGDSLSMVPVAIAMPLVLLFTLALWDYLVIRPCIERFRYYDSIRGKAATSTLLALGYAFSHGGYGAWLARLTGTSVKASAGIVLYIMGSDLFAVSAVASTAAWLGDAELPGNLRVGVGVVAPILAVVLVVVSLSGRVLRLLRRDADHEFLLPWARVGPTQYLANIAGRCLNITAICTGTWIAMTAFGLEVPLRAVLVYMPVILMVGALPINVAGFGAVQAAWLMFEPWAPGERILAFVFIWQLMVTVVLLLRGLPFLRRVLREISEGPGSSPTPVEPAQSQAS